MSWKNSLSWIEDFIDNFYETHDREPTDQEIEEAMHDAAMKIDWNLRLDEEQKIKGNTLDRPK